MPEAAPAPPHPYTLTCPPLPTSPRMAREFVAAVLRSLGLDELLDAATLCTSELVTNAVLHAHGTDSLLHLTVEPTRIRLTVYDGSPAKPAPTDRDDDGENGRGLWLLEVLTDGRWGTEPGTSPGLNGREGKGVWCELTTSTPLTRSLS
ncbi:ATP-binding protein [Streptomyces sp. NPDC087440]|uniref:ATP-binding protein n=1 Tax=Streptomyces sp. NPDC087440 TaxID=3365790 RepID=UPI003825AAE3